MFFLFRHVVLLDTNSIYNKIIFDLFSVVKVSCGSLSHLAAEGGKLDTPPLSVAAGGRQLREAIGPRVMGFFCCLFGGFFLCWDKSSQSRLPAYLLTSCFLCWDDPSSGNAPLLLLAVDEMLPMAMAGVRGDTAFHQCPLQTAVLTPEAPRMELMQFLWFGCPGPVFSRGKAGREEVVMRERAACLGRTAVQ